VEPFIERKKSTPSSLRGKVALVTGATRGIGAAVARSLAAEGCHLILTGRDSSALKSITTESTRHAVQVLALSCDVRDPSEVQALCGAFKKKFRRLDILVNNAGIGHASLTVDALPVESWNEVIATNLTGMFLVTHFALPLMKGGAAIVNNLSIAAKRVFPGSAAYNASKHGALGFTNTLREELRPKGIRVISILPGATDTAIWNSLWPKAPRKKMMAPASVAAAIINALAQPPELTVEEVVMLPSSGTL